MFNVVINNEQYNEYLTQKEKIKELEVHIKELEASNNVLKAQLKMECKAYQSVLSDKVPLIKERDALRTKIDDLQSKIKNLEVRNATIAINPCRDSDEVYSPDRNTTINIKNLYITNNYFSEEDKNND